jgi:hypothetical protein
VFPVLCIDADGVGRGGFGLISPSNFCVPQVNSLGTIFRYVLAVPGWWTLLLTLLMSRSEIGWLRFREPLSRWRNCFRKLYNGLPSMSPTPQQGRRSANAIIDRAIRDNWPWECLLYSCCVVLY